MRRASLCSNASHSIALSLDPPSIPGLTARGQGSAWISLEGPGREPSPRQQGMIDQAIAGDLAAGERRGVPQAVSVSAAQVVSEQSRS